MSLDVLFRSIGSQIRQPDSNLISSLQSSDASEAQLLSASTFLEQTYDSGERGRLSRAQTPMSRGQTPMVRLTLDHELPGSFPRSSIASTRDSHHSRIPFWQRLSSKKPSNISHAYPNLQDGLHPHAHTRKLPLPSISTLPSTPSTIHHTIPLPSTSSTYAIIISMYEVYNDRIFDLLASTTSLTPTPNGLPTTSALKKALTRRPLLFKSTESSPSQKHVAGLRKIVCGSYTDALLVLEAGLAERRVAGTGSNSVSSRSHGFFCIEVRQSSPSPHRLGAETWSGGTLSIVDLAGSERARNAKTTGSTLAEAGKINESLMYLGQCLQVQSESTNDGSKPIVPFRQCKLTELLFTNSFSNTGRPSQKGIMIVTADPQGDFNATSQILRYSALAREVTVPRVPSVQLQGRGHGGNGLPTPGNSGRNSPEDIAVLGKELEQATNEVERLSDECNALAVRLAEEEILRSEAELRAQTLQERLHASRTPAGIGNGGHSDDGEGDEGAGRDVQGAGGTLEERLRAEIEERVRLEVWAEMEHMMEKERNRWRQAWDEERERVGMWVDEKVDVVQNMGSPRKRKVGAS
jgi:hypothetical protein